MQSFLLIFLFLILFKCSYSEVVCYQCHANSTSTGLTCNIENTCIASYCLSILNPDETWIMNCPPSDSTEFSSGCSKDTDTEVVTCECNTNLCNSMDKMLIDLSAASGLLENVNASVNLPITNLTCLDCGSVVSKDGLNFTIPCDGSNVCKGVQCLTKRSVIPISYCASSWDVPPSLSCIHEVGEDEVCACYQDYCNIPYEALIPPTTTSTTTILTTTTTPKVSTTTTTIPLTTALKTTSLTPIPTTASPTTSQTIPLTTVLTTTSLTTIPTTTFPTTSETIPSTTTLPGTIVCPDGKVYGPNEQAVIMGEKLKDIILGNFGKNSSDALNNFESGINYHICNYKNGKK
uniref:Phospholipase A2 inhibitor and Ly6/PLAUR domain-containing protein-like n=1 Tax=Parastrongyloides trichosuri TaxID=131310 RepID=A0A0N4Z023_PARTI